MREVWRRKEDDEMKKNIKRFKDEGERIMRERE